MIWYHLTAYSSNKLTNQMLVLLQAWVSVSWQHLSVCVHIHPLALSLLEQALQVMHVMASHKDSLALNRVQGHLSGGGLAKPAVAYHTVQEVVSCCSCIVLVLHGCPLQRPASWS